MATRGRWGGWRGIYGGREAAPDPGAGRIALDRASSGKAASGEFGREPSGWPRGAVLYLLPGAGMADWKKELTRFAGRVETRLDEQRERLGLTGGRDRKARIETYRTFGCADRAYV